MMEGQSKWPDGLQTEYELSFYEELGRMDDRSGGMLVRDRRTQVLGVRKNLAVYNENVYRALMARPAFHVPRILWMGKSSGSLTVIEQYVNGTTLQAELDRGRRFSEQEVRGILRQLCLILRDLHVRAPAIIHRDIKPANVLLGQAGEIWLLDLNAAKPWVPGQSRDTQLIGTPGYAAPEQYGFGSSGAGADLYALGAMANVLLTGKLPSYGIPEGQLGDIIRQCCAMDPADRPMSAYELQLMLEGKAAAPKQAVSAPKPKRYYKYLPPGFRSLNPLFMIGMAVIYCACFSISLESTPFRENASTAEIWGDKLMMLVWLLGTVFFTGNYLGVQDHIPLCRSKKLPLRIIGILIGDAAIFCLVITVTVIIYDIFGWGF